MGHRNLVSDEKKAFARELRKNMTNAERLLAAEICKRKQKFVARFRPQAVVYGWIADFWCPRHGIVVEVDGSAHWSEEAKAKDSYRDMVMASYRIAVIRFTNEDVLHRMPYVLDKIRATVGSVIDHSHGKVWSSKRKKVTKKENYILSKKGEGAPAP